MNRGRTVPSPPCDLLVLLRIDHKNLLREDERPTPKEETPEAHKEEEMTTFFFVIAKERDVLAFELMLRQ